MAFLCVCHVSAEPQHRYRSLVNWTSFLFAGLWSFVALSDVDVHHIFGTTLQLGFVHVTCMTTFYITVRTTQMNNMARHSKAGDALYGASIVFTNLCLATTVALVLTNAIPFLMPFSPQ